MSRIGSGVVSQHELKKSELLHFSDKSILITGAGGFIGMALADFLIHANESFDLHMKIILLSRSFDSQIIENLMQMEDSYITLIKSNVAECDFEKEFENVEIDYVFHAATSAISNIATTGESQMRESIIGTERLLNFFKNSKTKPVFIHLSSGAVYGADTKSTKKIKATNEKIGLTNLSLYANTKIEIEELVIRATDNHYIKGSNPRLFSFYGPRLPLDSHFAIGNFVRDSLMDRSISINGNPNSQRSYLHVGDLVRKLIILSAKPTLNAINVGSDLEISMGRLAELIREEFNSKSRIDVKYPDAEPNYYIPDVKTSNDYLNDHYERDFKIGLNDWKNWILNGKV